jgi:hypothetical protein
MKKRSEKAPTNDLDKAQKLLNDPKFLAGYLYMGLDAWKSNNGVYIQSRDSKDKTEEYMLENNPLYDWLMNYEKSDKFIRISALVKDYQHKYDQITAKKFHEQLQQAKVLVKIDNSHGHKVYLQLRSNDEELIDDEKNNN